MATAAAIVLLVSFFICGLTGVHIGLSDSRDEDALGMVYVGLGFASVGLLVLSWLAGDLTVRRVPIWLAPAGAAMASAHLWVPAARRKVADWRAHLAVSAQDDFRSRKWHNVVVSTAAAKRSKAIVEVLDKALLEGEELLGVWGVIEQTPYDFVCATNERLVLVDSRTGASNEPRWVKWSAIERLLLPDDADPLRKLVCVLPGDKVMRFGSAYESACRSDLTNLVLRLLRTSRTRPDSAAVDASSQSGIETLRFEDRSTMRSQDAAAMKRQQAERERRRKEQQAEREKRLKEQQAETERRRQEQLAAEAEQAEDARQKKLALHRADAERAAKLQAQRERSALEVGGRARVPKNADDLEEVAAEFMRKAGFPDAKRTPKGPDGGVDVLARRAVGQAKFHGSQRVVADSVRALHGARAERGVTHALFFVFGAGYTADALATARTLSVHCFEYNVDKQTFDRVK